MALVVLIRWELVYARQPERFYYGTNTSLQCTHCKDETCQIKKHVKKLNEIPKNNDECTAKTIHYRQ